MPDTGPQAPHNNVCGALSTRVACDLPLHPDNPNAHSWAQATNLRTANAQEGGNRDTETPRAEQSGGGPPSPADESTAQTPSQDEIRWQVQEVYAQGYGNSTGHSVREHHLAGLRAVADHLINRHRRS